MVDRLDATLTTVEGLERHEGHLLNWYDTRDLSPLLAALRLHGRQRQPRRCAARAGGRAAGSSRLPSLRASVPALGPGPPRATAFADGMSFGFLYDRERQLFSIGYRLADVAGPGRLDTSYYDLLASEARLASFFAIAKGDVPQSHWFRLGRLVVSVEGVPTLVSWSASMFEYLMPLLLMRTYPGTLLDQSCRMAVQQQIRYGRRRGVPWGISESAYNLVDRLGNFQYKAFGVPGLGLKRGLADELVVAPYATALAAMVDPAEAARNLGRLEKRGRAGRARLLRRGRLHVAKAGRVRWRAPRARPGLRGRREVVLRASPGDDPGGARERSAGRRDGRPLPCGPADPGDRAPPAGTDPAEGTGDQAASRRGDPRGPGAGRARPAGSARRTRPGRRADPLERRLCLDRHERGRRSKPLSRPRRDPLARRPYARSGKPVRLSARRPHRHRLVRAPTSRSARNRTAISWSS